MIGHQDLISQLAPVVDPLEDHLLLHRPSNVVEPPESADDQAKIKHWRDRALQAEARLAEQDHQLQNQNIDILDLSWKARIAEEWNIWYVANYGMGDTLPGDLAGPTRSLGGSGTLAPRSRLPTSPTRSRGGGALWGEGGGHELD